MIKTKCFLVTFLFNIVNTFYCSGKSPSTISDCTSLSTLAYNCCYIQGNSITTTFLTYQLCYGFKAGKDPNQYPTPSLSPQININVMECGTVNTQIKKTDLCGVDNPQNSTLCSSFGSNCCYLDYQGLTFCLNYDTFDWRGTGVVLDCSETKFYSSFSLFLIYLLFIL